LHCERNIVQRQRGEPDNHLPEDAGKPFDEVIRDHAILNKGMARDIPCPREAISGPDRKEAEELWYRD
jgi:hypothetical protein